MTLSPNSVRRSLSRINARKAPGPDNIPGRVLRDCAVELTDVFTDIFNISLSQAVVPTCFKATTIIPVPKKSSPSCFNDYRPVALTPILMKCFERLVMQHIKSVLPPSLDPFQFAYRSNRSTDDAIATALHPALTHLDKKDSYVRLLFIDFSSAFNTIIPQQLIHKLVQLGLNTSLNTSPGPTTLQHWPRKHNSVSTSSANSEEPEPRPSSCAPSTEAPSRASWLAASLLTRPAPSPFNG